MTALGLVIGTVYLARRAGIELAWRIVNHVWPEPAPLEEVPLDDLMAVADAVGVTAQPAVDVEFLIDWHAHPTHRAEFADPQLAQMLEAWSRAAAGGDES